MDAPWPTTTTLPAPFDNFTLAPGEVKTTWTQSDFTARWIAAHRPELADVPVLSAAAAFKTGFAGPDDYTDIAPGPLTQRSAIDLYLYANTIAAVLTDGATVKAWLERSATRFNQIDPAKAEAQPLINKKLPGYNFDVLQGALDYTIDLSRTAGARIVSLRYRGEAVRPEQRFVVATNNYRATDAGIAGLDQAEVLFSGLACAVPTRIRAGRDGLEQSPGPLIIEEYDSTIVAPPGWSASTTPQGAVELRKRAG